MIRQCFFPRGPSTEIVQLIHNDHGQSILISILLNLCANFVEMLSRPTDNWSRVIHSVFRMINQKQYFLAVILSLFLYLAAFGVQILSLLAPPSAMPNPSSSSSIRSLFLFDRNIKQR